MKYMLFYLCVGMLAASCAGRASRPSANVADAARPVLPDTVASMPPLVDTVRRAYTEQELAALQDSIHLRLQRLKGTSIAENVWGSSVLPGTLEVNLRVNSPEQQAEFRRRVADVPAISFSGTAVPPLCPVVGANDTLGLYLRPEYTVYSARVPEARFVLYNCSGKFVYYGEDCFVAYCDTLRQWRELPTAMTHHDLGHRLSDNRSDTFRVPLYPLLNRNRPGTYRFFKEVEISRQKLLLMTEFRLTDNEQEYRDASLTDVPPEVERYRENAGPDILDYAEVMPSFPGGEDAMRDYIQKNISLDVKEKKRVIVGVVVEPDGTLTNVEIYRSAGDTLDKEALRIVKQMPRWNPGKMRGKPVRVRFPILVVFGRK